MPGRCPGDSPFDRRREAASVPRRQVQGMGPSQQTGVRGQARRLYGLRTVRPGMSGSTRHQVEAQDLGLKGAVLLLYDSPDTVPPGQLIMRLAHYGSEPSEFDFQRPVGADLSNCGSLGGGSQTIMGSWTLRLSSIAANQHDPGLSDTYTAHGQLTASRVGISAAGTAHSCWPSDLRVAGPRHTEETACASAETSKIRGKPRARP